MYFQITKNENRNDDKSEIQLASNGAVGVGIGDISISSFSIFKFIKSRLISDIGAQANELNTLSLH